MTYNSAHFDKSIVTRIEKKINCVSQCEEIVLDAIISFLKSTKNFAQTDNFNSFIHLIIKMRFNLANGKEVTHSVLEQRYNEIVSSNYSF